MHLHRRQETGSGRSITLLAAALVIGGVTVTAAGAADWPQWRGPARVGISGEKAWLSSWGGNGPRQVWSADVGEGYSTVVVKAGRVFTMGNTGGKDVLSCLDAATGRKVWNFSYASPAGDYGGPRSTPTVDGNVVYSMSREAVAHCVNAANGKVIWSRDLRKETGGETPRWGFAGSPLVHGGRIYYNVGGAGIALDGGGRVVWKSRGGTAGYSSPVTYGKGAQQSILLFTGPGLVAVSPQNGKKLWEFPWNTSYDVNAADPIVFGEHVFISSNYGRGGALLKVAGNRPSVIWQNRNMRNHFNTCVLLGGHFYGNDENTLKCIDAATGVERWRSRGRGKGGLIAANGKLIVMTERGELLVAQANPAGYTELARARVLDGTCWTSPTLANGMIYCRNHEGKLVCLDVRAKG
jgi:outer membrane protein assembly factor BamB